MTYETCPDCGREMSSSDSGEPNYDPGWWCEECARYWSDDELADYAETCDHDYLDAEGFCIDCGVHVSDRIGVPKTRDDEENA